jgi:excisionase family DNA binding protein
VAAEKWYSIEEAAEFLGISAVTLRRYIKSQRISAYQIAGRYRFKQQALEDFLESCRLGPDRQEDRQKGKKKARPDNPVYGVETESLAEEVLKNAPQRVKSLYTKAFAASRMGRYEEAERYYQEILKAEPQNSAAYLFLGLLYDEMDSQDRALEMWREVMNRDKGSELAAVAQYHITKVLRAK